MAQIFDSLKKLIEPELSKAAHTLGAPAAQIATAASGILPGILSKIFHKGASTPVDNAIAAGDGGRLIHSLFGDHTDDFNAHIARQSGLGQEHATQLVALISGAVAVFLKGKNLKGAGLVNELDGEMNAIKKAISPDMKDIPLTMPKPHVQAHAQAPAQKAAPAAAAQPDRPNVKKKGGLAWLWWLLLALLLLLLLLLCFRSCRNRKAVEPLAAVVAPVATAVVPAATTAAPCNTDIVLPDGVTLSNVPCDGVERKMVDFLNSDTYKNGQDADLRNHWFEFEDVDFVRDSASEFTNTSLADLRLSHIAAILKAYPAARIRIGGFADKSGGNANYNLEISKARAVWIDQLLDRKGIDVHRTSTEGFGDEFAVFPATASATQAATDRDIAFRFTK